MAKIIGLLWVIGAIINPTVTKVLLGKSVDLIHSLFGVVLHHINTIQQDYIMKEFKVTFSDIVFFTTIIEAESEDEAYRKFLDGEFGDIEEIDREYDRYIKTEEV